MNYKQITFDLNGREAFVSDLLIGVLSEIGFDGFFQEGESLKAYIAEDGFSERDMCDALQEIPLLKTVLYKVDDLVSKDWNEQWERESFRPIVVADRCVIHHPQDLVDNYEYEILLEPRMSFGTAYHDTTYQILEHLLQMDLEGKRFLDMGCGTGVLGLLAINCGARQVVAIDVDENACENTQHNAALNGVVVDVRHGDAALLHDMEFDVICANINRNILLHDMEAYVRVLAFGGTLVLSGFYVDDLPMIERKASELHLVKEAQTSRSDWAVIVFKKR